MKEEGFTDALLREFLLGKVNEEERERIENLFLTDTQARERILAAEQDLIEDYLEDSLAAADEESFLSRYGQTSTQQRQLQINKSIKKWALSESSSTHAVPVKISVWTYLRERLRLKPALIIPIAATALIAVVVAAVWLSSRREQQNRHLAIEHVLAELNAFESLREVPPHMRSLVLSPVTVRSSEQQPEINTRDDTRIVELRLPWIKERYSTYQAEVRRVGDDESFTIFNLQAETDGEYVIRIRLPVQMLRRGQYQVLLAAISSDGSASLAEDYRFTVAD